MIRSKINSYMLKEMKLKLPGDAPDADLTDLQLF